MHREIYSNSIDQILAKDSPGNWFSFFYDERTTEVRIEDNGKSLPFNDIVRILTANHTSKNFEKKLFDYSSGLHGSGSKIVNSLSLIYVIEAYHYDGTAVKMEFEKGYPKTKEPVKIPNPDKKQGLVTYFIPDPEIMGEDIRLEWKKSYTRIKQAMSLTPIGSICDFTAIDINGKKFTERIINKDGIITDLIMKVNNPINKPIIFNADDGIHKLDIAFCYDAGNSETGPDDKEDVTSFANFSPTLGGTHVDGSIEGICRWFMMYMNNIYLSSQKNSKIKVTFADIKSGLNVFISAAHLDPILTGQSKEMLSNEDMTGFCKEVVMKGLDNWSKTNPQDLAKICKFLKEMAELRLKQEAGKAKIVTKYAKNPITNLPRKYVKPTGKTGIELFIVEGDSALGKAKEDRNTEFQGLFPIRGKIINAFKASRQAFFSNEEVQGITQIIFGQEYRKGLTVEDAKVEKIIIMADADVDGAHIAALLLRMFVMYFPFLIEAGMLYKAIPPLYSIKEGKKHRYFTDNIDMIKYDQKVFLSKNSFKDMKKNDIAAKEITKFLLRNADYCYYLEKLANTYAVNPFLLEMVLMHYVANKEKIVFDKLKKEVTSAYRFMNVEKSKNTIVVKGSIEMSNLIIISDQFLADCRILINLIKDNDAFYYNLNGKKSSLYEVLLSYKKSTSNSVQRYKGLGEMGDGQLGESTMDPNSRTLIRYTLDNAKEAINLIREYESNSKKILSEVGQVTRDDLLD